MRESACDRRERETREEGDTEREAVAERRVELAEVHS